MDLRRERRKGRRIAGFAVTTIALVMAVLLAVLVSVTSEQDIVKPIKGADDRAESAPNGITAIFEKENAADEFSYEIKESLSFEDAESSGKILLKNPTVNRYLMYIEIKVDEKIVLKTGNIAPGQVIKEVRLDKKLSKGEHAATAYIYAVDPESYNTVGVVTQPITIKIKK